jgi:uncharacterized Tic20 family protein
MPRLNRQRDQTSDAGSHGGPAKEAKQMSEEDREVLESLGQEEETPRTETRRLELEVVEIAPSAHPHLGLTRAEMGWAAAAHASILLTLLLGLISGGLAALIGVAVPALIWYTYRDRSEYVAEQARQATIFQLACFVALLALVVGGTALLVVGWLVSGVLVLVLVGVLLVPVMLILTVLLVVALVALPIVWVVYGCYAALETYNGRPFRYAYISDLVDRYEAQA